MHIPEQYYAPNSITVDNQEVILSDFFRQFSESRYVALFDGLSRWKDFKHPDMSHDLFQSILGRGDVGNWNHEILSRHLMRKVFLPLCKHPPLVWGNKTVPDAAILTPYEEAIAVILAGRHDDAESTLTDTAQPAKTKKSEILENVELLRIANELSESTHKGFGKIFKESFLSAKSQYIDQINPDFEGFLALYRDLYRVYHGENEQFGVLFQTFDTGMFTEGTKLYKLFSIFEKSGYLRTGLHGWTVQKERKNPAITDEIADRLQALGRGVLLNGFSKLIEAAEIYPPIFLQLIANAKTIREIFSADEQEVAAQLYKYQQYKTQHEYAVLFSQNREKWRVFETIYAHQIETYDPQDP